MKNIMTYWPFLIPILAVQLGLCIAALVHVLTHKKYRFGNRVIWIIIVVFGEILGPILYFTIGKGDED